jgi:hypothetical protein
MNCNSNGRVDILGDNVLNSFQLHDKMPVGGSDNYARNALTGNWEGNNLSKTFFSKGNIDILQNGIRAGVYNESKGRFLIGKQDEDPLKIIMRSIFLTHSKNLPNQITQQVEQLNQMVLDYSVPQVLGEAVGYVKFKNDISMMYTPMTRPTSTFHNNTLELKPWF